MPSCYECGRETPVTQFYLLRNYLPDGERSTWWYGCGLRCLKELVLKKANVGSFLLKEYETTCGRSWFFNSREELIDFVSRLGR